MNGSDILRAREALHSIDAGLDRATWVRMAMAAKAAGLELEDFDAWSAQAGNYKGAADCASVWRSISPDGGIGAGSLFATAREHGWRDDSSAHQARQKPQEPPKQPEQGRRPAFDVAAAWGASRPADSAHPYIARKHGIPAGLRVYHGPLKVAGRALEGALVVPAFGNDGNLKTAQFILPDGVKLNAPGRPMDGAFAVGKIRRPGDGATVFICEGIGAAWACHKASGSPAVVAFGAHRMEAVLRQFSEPYPNARFVLVADAGKEHQCCEIAKTHRATWVEMPQGSPGNFDAGDLAQRDGLDALAALLAAPREPAQRFPLLTAEQLAARPPVPWRVHGVLPALGIGALYGPPGSGKSFVAIDMLGAIDAGRDWFGCRVKKAPGLYIALEGEAGLAQRARAYQARNGATGRMRFLATPLDIRKPEDRAELVRTAESAGLRDGVVLVDTLAASAPGMDENSSADMGEIIGALKGIQAALGGLVLAVHHTGKDSTKGLRGHSSLLGALDCSLEITRTDERREWRIAKSKDGADGEAHPFRLEIVELGADEDGEPITSCVVAPAERTAEGIRRAALPGGGNMRLAYDAIVAALKDSRAFGREAAPPGRPCIELEEAIAAAAASLPCDSKRRRERAQQAITALVARHNLAHQEGWIWLP